MSFTRIQSLAAVVLAVGFAAPASAAVILDQNFVTTDDPNNNTALGIVTTSLAQTFTVGISGKLDSIVIQVLQDPATTGDLIGDIRALTGSAPASLASSALASVTVANGGIGTIGSTPYAWTSILVDVSAANIMVTSGDMLSFVLSSPIGEVFFAQTDYTNAYAGGSRWSQDGDGTPFSELASADLAFKTYVDTELPEPATLVIFGVGLAGLGYVRRRRSA